MGVIRPDLRGHRLAVSDVQPAASDVQAKAKDAEGLHFPSVSDSSIENMPGWLSLQTFPDATPPGLGSEVGFVGGPKWAGADANTGNPTGNWFGPWPAP